MQTTVSRLVRRSASAPEQGRRLFRLVQALRARYLLEIAGQIDRENAVFMFADSGAPTLVREGDDMTAVYVVMPMRV